MTDDTTGATPKRNWLHIGLWVVQVLLAVAYGMAGTMKLVTPLPELATQMSFVADSPALLVRFIGFVEVAGALGMILPALTRILPGLTPLAAAGFSVIQILAIGVHAAYGETGQTLPVNLVLLALSVFVLWGRWKRVPILPRG